MLKRYLSIAKSQVIEGQERHILRGQFLRMDAMESLQIYEGFLSLFVILGHLPGEHCLHRDLTAHTDATFPLLREDSFDTLDEQEPGGWGDLESCIVGFCPPPEVKEGIGLQEESFEPICKSEVLKVKLARQAI